MSQVENLFLRFREITNGDNVAAAILTLAEITSHRGKDQSPDRCLNVSDVAAKLNVSTGTIRNLVTTGKLLASRIGNGRGTLRFDPAEIERFQKQSAGSRLPMRRLTR